MNEFKVGDWVTTKAGYTKQISGLTRDACDTLSIGNTSVGINVVFKNEIELWQPEIGEWCWFWEIDSNPKLCQYSKYINGEYEALSIDPYYELEGHFGFCEPFIGELPSFIKERSCNQLT